MALLFFWGKASMDENPIRDSIRDQTFRPALLCLEQVVESDVIYRVQAELWNQVGHSVNMALREVFWLEAERPLRDNLVDQQRVAR